jgi:integrase
VNTLLSVLLGGALAIVGSILRDIVRPAVAAANGTLVESGLPAIASTVTNHTMRRTFASLLYEAGASPREVMDQMGHTRPDLALEIYAKKMERSRETGARMDALIKGSWSEKPDVALMLVLPSD